MTFSRFSKSGVQAVSYQQLRVNFSRIRYTDSSQPYHRAEINKVLWSSPLTVATPSDDYQRQRPTGPGIMSFGESSRGGVTRAHPWSMRTWIPCHFAYHGACLGACHNCACHGGLSSDVLGAAAGAVYRMLFRIPLRMPFACHSMACACYRACNGPIRLIFELLIIYRVAEPADSKYYLLTGPCPDPWLADPTEPRVGI